MVFKEANTADIAFIEGLIGTGTGCVVVDVKKKNSVIEVIIHREDGCVGIDDCVAVTKLLECPEFYGRFGDEAVINAASPGLERRLTTARELSVFQGQEVALEAEIDGKFAGIRGVLGPSDGAAVVVAGKTVETAKVMNLHLYYEFE
jgi:ribosome maturation factor RimP